MNDTESRIFELGKGAFTSGFVIGGILGGRKASVQFAVENQQRMIKRSEIIIQIRSFNERVVWAFAKEGAIVGVKFGLIGIMYGAVKECSKEYIGESGSDILTGPLLGSTLFSSLARGGERLYYFRRGLIFGGILGISIASLRKIFDLIQNKNYIS